MITVPGSTGRTINDAFEDVRAAHVTCDITDLIQQSIDQHEDNIEDLMHTSQPVSTSIDLTRSDINNSNSFQSPHMISTEGINCKTTCT